MTTGQSACCRRRLCVSTLHGLLTHGLERYAHFVSLCVNNFVWSLLPARCPNPPDRVNVAVQGVERQVAAFTDAMKQVLPVSKLLVFTTSELLESVCGEAVHWDEETVRDCIVSHFMRLWFFDSVTSTRGHTGTMLSRDAMCVQIPGEGYTSTDPPYQWLLLEVVSMGPSARKDFLKFVTARVRLPSGGLRALSRKVRPARASHVLLATSRLTAMTLQVEIRRSAADVRTVPHGHTCALALDLPAYTSQTELHVMLYKALELMNQYDTGLYD